MKAKRLWFILGILLVLAAGVRIFSGNTGLVESAYSTGVYKGISQFLRYLLGWLPFSFGDLLYGLCIVWLAWKLIMGIRAIAQKKITKESFGTGILRSFILATVIYIIFNLFWGINYNRRGITSQLGLTIEKYTIDDLKAINAILLEKANQSKAALTRTSRQLNGKQEVFDLSVKAYQEIAVTYPFLEYRPVAIKSSLWGWMGNYLGFTGYYNPFTGEAQVNTTVPRFLQPYTTCHEIAHQLGYAKENEANFVGYLAASASKDTLLHYSVYLDLFLYSNRNLYMIDSVVAKGYAKQLLPAIKADLKEWKEFNQSHKSVVEPVIRWLYGKYLENNQQPSGVLSYDEVTGFLIAYYRKFGKL